MNDPAIEPSRFVLRPCRPEDLDALQRFAEASAHGLTTLPDDRARLAERIERSMHSFSTFDASGEEQYLFVIDDIDSGRVVGVSGIAAQAGFGDRFYTYRNEFVVRRSQALGMVTRTHTLHLCHDLTGATLLTSFYIEPGYRHSLAPQLLSRGRLLFIAQHPELFSDRVAAENPGLSDDSGRCPFWNSVGQRFFGMDYPAVERIAGGRSKAFMGDLLPSSPVYVPLLPDQAQWAIGQLHPDAELPFSILRSEGFETDTYVDIFDGGPIVVSRLASLHCASKMRLAQVADRSATAGPAAAALVATTSRTQFRASIATVSTTATGVGLDAAARVDLRVRNGERVCLAPLPLDLEAP